MCCCLIGLGIVTSVLFSLDCSPPYSPSSPEYSPGYITDEDEFKPRCIPVAFNPPFSTGNNAPIVISDDDEEECAVVENADEFLAMEEEEEREVDVVQQDVNGR